MFALLTVGLVLHHVEGVCKPKSAATLMRERLYERYQEYVAQRDVEAAIDRARERGETRRQAAAERAEGVRQARTARSTGRTVGGSQRRPPQAVEAPDPRPEWQQSDVGAREAEHHYQREG